MGIEVFDFPFVENDVTAGEGVFTLIPGETDILSTQNTLAFNESAVLDDPIVVQGSARILATSKKIICTAFLLDAANSDPAYIMTLPVFKKTKQVGQ